MKSLLRRFKKHHHLIITVSMCLIFFIVIGSLFLVVTTKIAMVLTERKVAGVLSGIEVDRAHVLRETQEIVAGRTLDDLIVARDHEHTLTLLDEERIRRHLTVAVAVDRDGVALARTPNIGSYGDYVGLTQPWGRAAMRGESTAMIGLGRSFSMVMIAAVPIKKDGAVMGAVYGGYRIDDAYAREFKKAHMTRGAQVAFYSNEEGLIGDSFNDATTTQVLSGNVNIGTNWIQGGQSPSHVLLGGKGYFVKNIPIQDSTLQNEQIGGVLIFLPDQFMNANAFASAGIALLVFVFFWHRTTPMRLKKRVTMVMIVGLSFAIGVAVFLSCATFIERQMLRLDHVPFTIYNSTLAFVPDFNMSNLFTEQRVSIEVNTGGEKINALQMVVHYDPHLVRIDGIVTLNSICENGLFLEKEIDDIRGEVHISCIVLPPAFSGDHGKVADLLIVPKKLGTFTLTFGSATQVLASDGLGTDVLRQSTSGSYEVSALKTLSAALGADSFIPVFSPTHPNSERWYKRKAIQLFWPTASGEQYLTVFDQFPGTIPKASGPNATTPLERTVPEDGIYYFHLRAASGTGATTHFRIKIDSTPPLLPTIKASATLVHPGDIVRFEFSGRDDQSGLQKNFYVNIDDSILLPSLPTLYIPFAEPGTHSVSVRVFDQAGNWSDSTVFITVAA